MNIYDNAHNLAKSIKSSDEYNDLKKALDKVKADKSAENILQDFKNKQMQIQKSQMNGEKIDDTQMKKIQELYQIAMLNPIVAQYFQCEFRFMQTMEDVYKILGEAIDFGYDMKK